MTCILEWLAATAAGLGSVAGGIAVFIGFLFLLAIVLVKGEEAWKHVESSASPDGRVAWVIGWVRHAGNWLDRYSPVVMIAILLLGAVGLMTFAMHQKFFGCDECTPSWVTCSADATNTGMDTP